MSPLALALAKLNPRGSVLDVRLAAVWWSRDLRRCDMLGLLLR